MDRMAHQADEERLEDLIASCAGGDRPAFSRLYQLTSGRLFAVTLRIMGQRALAEEVLQEAYLTLWRRAGQYSPERGAPMAWMTTIARNQAIDRLRREKISPRKFKSLDEEEGLLPELAAGEADLAVEVSVSIRKCVDGLQNNHRKAVLLAYYYGMTHEELAEQLDAPLGTVKSWIRRGLSQLKDCMAT